MEGRPGAFLRGNFPSAASGGSGSGRGNFPSAVSGGSGGGWHCKSNRSRAGTVDVKQISKDLPRTFAEQASVQSCAAEIEAVLLECAREDPELGYCQGMNCIAAVAVVQLRPDRAAAASRFRAFLSSLRGLWLSGFPLLYLGFMAFDILAHNQLHDLRRHFTKLGMNHDLLTTGILTGEWLSLFSRWLPFKSLWAAFEFIEAEGLPGLLGLTAAILQVHTTALTEAADFTSLFVLLKDLRMQPKQPKMDRLLARAQDFLPAAKDAVMQAENSEICSHHSQYSVTRSGSRVVHSHSADLELVLLAEEAKAAFVELAKGLTTVYETVWDLTNDAFTNSRSGLSNAGLSSWNLTRLSGKSSPKRRRALCGSCRQAKSDDED